MPGEQHFGTDPPLVHPTPERQLHIAAHNVRMMLQVTPPAADVKLHSQKHNHHLPAVPSAPNKHHSCILSVGSEQARSWSRSSFQTRSFFSSLSLSASKSLSFQNAAANVDSTPPLGAKWSIFTVSFYGAVEFALLSEQTAEEQVHNGAVYPGEWFTDAPLNISE